VELSLSLDVPGIKVLRTLKRWKWKTA